MSVVYQSAAKPIWFKSSYSGGNTTECVETAFVPSGVLIRDSKRPGHPHMVVSEVAWADFVTRTRNTAAGTQT